MNALYCAALEGEFVLACLLYLLLLTTELIEVHQIEVLV